MHFSIKFVFCISCILFSSVLSNGQGIYPQASARVLTPRDLEGLDKAELKIMRNEIFARYGYQFKTKDMQEYFSRQTWYRPRLADVTSMLSSVERKNVELIKQYEAKTDAGTVSKTANLNVNPGVNGQYPQGSTKLLTAQDLAGMDKGQLKIMRNEIFARYGYQFKTREMQDYFGRQAWYRPTAADVSSRLSVIERKNVEFIKQMESAVENSSIYAPGVDTSDGSVSFDIDKQTVLSTLIGRHKLTAIGGFSGYTSVDYSFSDGKWSANGISSNGGAHMWEIELSKEELARLNSMAIVISADLTMTLTVNGKEYFRSEFNAAGMNYDLQRKPEDFGLNASMGPDTRVIDKKLYLFARENLSEAELEAIDVPGFGLNVGLIYFDIKSGLFVLELTEPCCDKKEEDQVFEGMDTPPQQGSVSFTFIK